MTAKGEGDPGLRMVMAQGRGRCPFAFVQILPPEAACAVHSALPISSFMISLVPP